MSGPSHPVAPGLAASRGRSAAAIPKPTALDPGRARLGGEPYRSLAALAGALERMAAAVVHHDAAELAAATSAASELLVRVERLAADGLGPTMTDRPDPLLDDLVGRLGAGARLAAQLIERAWVSEAAAVQLLARCLGAQPDGSGPYRPARPDGGPTVPGVVDGAAVVERRA